MPLSRQTPRRCGLTTADCRDRWNEICPSRCAILRADTDLFEIDDVAGIVVLETDESVFRRESADPEVSNPVRGANRSSAPEVALTMPTPLTLLEEVSVCVP